MQLLGIPALQAGSSSQTSAVQWLHGILPELRAPHKRVLKRRDSAGVCCPIASAFEPPRKNHSPRREQWRCHAIKIDRSKKLPEEDAFRSDEDLEMCPAECVRELKTLAELEFVKAWGAKRGVLIVVDFYRTACGSCKYIEQGFAKICRVEGEQQVPVMFFKHNVMDDREEMSDIAEDLRIKDGKLVEFFSTREKARILETVNRLSGQESATAE